MAPFRVEASSVPFAYLHKLSPNSEDPELNPTFRISPKVYDKVTMGRKCKECKRTHRSCC